MPARRSAPRGYRSTGYSLAKAAFMQDLGRTLIFLGLALAFAGVVILALGRFNLPLGRLPGDLKWQGRGWFVSVPLATSILVSVLLSLILWIASRFRR
jgi:hypothetical protein